MVARDNGQGTPPSGIRLRAFPLGLLAPRFLRAPHSPHHSRLRTVWCGRRSRLGGGRAPPPSVSSPRASTKGGAPGIAGQGSANRHRQPPTTCSSMRFAGSLQLLYFFSSVRVGAHPWSTAALAEMPECEHPTSELLKSSNHCSCACPSLPCAHNPAHKRQEVLWAGLPSCR